MLPPPPLSNYWGGLPLFPPLLPTPMPCLETYFSGNFITYRRCADANPNNPFRPDAEFTQTGTAGGRKIYKSGAFSMAMFEDEDRVYIKCLFDHCLNESDTTCTTVSLEFELCGSPMFSTILRKENNHCDFLIAFQDDESLPRRAPLLKIRICS